MPETSSSVFFLLSLAEAEVLQQLTPAFQLLKLPELEEPDEAGNNEEEFWAITQISFGGGGGFYVIVFFCAVTF